MNHVHSSFIACRPKTLIASISPVCIGTALAISEHFFSFTIFLCTLFTGLGVQILTNLFNDLFDFLKGADTSHRKGPARVIASKLMTIKELQKLILLVMFCTIFCSGYLIFQGGVVVASLFPLSLLCAYGYTAGPFPLAYLGIAEVFIFIFFGPVATGMTHYLQTLTFSTQAFIAGISPGLFSCSILALNNLRDIEEDRQANKKTLVVRFGTHFGKWEYCAFLVIASCIPLFLYHKHPLYLLSTSILLPALFLMQAVMKNNDSLAYNVLFTKTGKLFFHYTLISSCSLIL